jgi:tight adherence protein C
MIFITAICFGVFSGCVFYLCLNQVFKKKLTIVKRLRFAATSNQSAADDPELNMSFGERMIKPVVTNLLGFFAMLIPQSATAQEKLTKQLMQAEIKMSAKNYSAAVMLFTVTCVIVFPLIGWLLGQPLLNCALLGLVGVYAGVVLSRFRLKSKIKRRKAEIYHQLPDALDLLSVSVAAGLGFDQALSYLVKKSKGALIREFDLANREIAMGRSRKEAMERMAERCESIEIRTFISAVIQADEMGASIKNVLQIQASTIRETHKQNVEEKMQKLAVKMLIPMVLFIFPVLFIVLLGPAVPSVIEAFGGFA